MVHVLKLMHNGMVLIMFARVLHSHREQSVFWKYNRENTERKEVQGRH
jgi:hypothetical protein